MRNVVAIFLLASGILGCRSAEPRLVSRWGAGVPETLPETDRFFVAGPHHSNPWGSLLESALATALAECIESPEFVDEGDQAEAEITLVTFPEPQLHSPWPPPEEGYLWVHFPPDLSLVLYRRSTRGCRSVECFFHSIAADFADQWCRAKAALCTPPGAPASCAADGPLDTASGLAHVLRPRDPSLRARRRNLRSWFVGWVGEA